MIREGFHSLAMIGDIQSLNKSIQDNPTNINAVNIHGFTALHAAAFHGQVECARMLIQAGADVNYPTRSPKFTYALHLAVNRLNYEIVRMLIVAGSADYALKDYRGRTALDISEMINVEDDSLAKSVDDKNEMLRVIRDAILSSRTDKKPRPFEFRSCFPKRKKSQPILEVQSDDEQEQERIYMMEHDFESSML